ncbi:MAG: exodeoxyribonuclease V subunit gamma, partial [Defluviitaleaceae bacterium]|nr:exodeoxyribonuclease V subunit gamma [Defluviitaleaceae bacterium]
MRLQYILGGAGAGKTGYILDDIVRASPDEKIIYLVPEQFSLQSERNLVARLPRGAALHAQVLSFRRLAYHVFSETGGGEYFDDIGKTMLLRKLLYERRKELRFFARAADKQGFMERLAAMIGEFYQYGVTCEKLISWAEGARHDSLRDKLNDLAVIYAGYTGYIENRYIPTDAMLDALAVRMDSSELIRGASVWISGFHGFTPQEYKVINGLIRSSARVTVALAVKENAKSFNVSYTDPFFETKRTVNRLTAIAGECGAAVDEPVFLGQDRGTVHVSCHGKTHEPSPCLARPLRFLEDNFLSDKPELYPDIPECVSVCRADDRYGEIHEAAAAITELVADWHTSSGTCDYGDIAVFVGDINTYGRDIKSIFELYDIPVFIDVKTDLSAHPFVEMILAMLDIPARNWSYESVFRFLKTGMTQLRRDEIDTLENYVLAYGIKGGARWAKERWEYGFEAYDSDQIHRLKEYVWDTLEPLRGRGKRTVKELSTVVFEILDRLKATETLDIHTNELELRGEQELVRRNRQIWKRICEIFDVLVGILGDERVSLAEFARILEAGFGAADMGIIPTAQIQVLTGDIERSRLPAVKALFIIGANDGILPAIGENPSLLDDNERERLDPNNESLAPGGRRRGYEQQFLIYHALAMPTERLHMSYSTGGPDGRAMRSSALITRIKKLYPK